MRLTALALAALAFPCRVTAQSNPGPQGVAKSLENHAVILRHYYTDTKLKFDSNGQLVSKGTEGFGPSDGRVYVQEVRLTSDTLLLNGTRLVNAYNAEQDRWEARDIGRKTSIEIAFPDGQALESAVPHILNSTFLNQSDSALLQCSPQEVQEFQNDILSRFKGGKHFESSTLPDVATLAELHNYCLPGGERAYLVRQGVKPPLAKHTSDPEYSEAARKAKLQGNTVLLLVIAPDGLPSAVSIVRSLCSSCDQHLRLLGQQLDWKAVEAVSKWKFKPANFQGTPLPVVINVEVNFKLY